MWAMCSFGILMPAVRPPKTIAKGDERTMQIRARRAKDLDILRARYMQGQLGKTIHTPSFDYEYRAYCKPEDFAWAMYSMILEIDYLKFKPTTELYADSELHACYNAIWGTVMRTLSTPRHRYDYWQGPVTKVTDTGVVMHKHYSTIHPPHELPAESTTGWPATEHRGGKADRDDYLPDVLDDIDSVIELGNYDFEAGATEALKEMLDAKTVELPFVGPTTANGAHAEVVGDEALNTPEALIGRAWAEIDAIMDGQNDAMNHESCDHGGSRNARDRCLRKKRREDDERITDLRLAIFEYEKATGLETGHVAGKV